MRETNPSDPISANPKTGVIFFASDAIALPTLEALLADDSMRPELVVTQPDRPAGRKQRMTPCPVRAFADETGLPVKTPVKAGDPEFVAEIEQMAPAIFVVAAYGQYLPARLLDIPGTASINLHPSLLPLYRGASPIQSALADGATRTGVTILHVGAEMDAGDIILQESLEIGPDETAIELRDRLARLGAELVVQAVQALRTGQAPRIPQDHAHASMTHKLSKEDGYLDWNLPAQKLHNLIRAYQPWPGCSCVLPQFENERVKVLRARVEPGSGQPGEIISEEGDGPLVATGASALRLLELQPPGRRAMCGADFLRGYSRV